MPNAQLLTARAFAELCGVKPPAIHSAVRGARLRAAACRVAGKLRIDARHQSAIDYRNGHTQRRPSQRSGVRAIVHQEGTAPPVVNLDPFEAACNLAASTGARRAPEQARDDFPVGAGEARASHAVVDELAAELTTAHGGNVFNLAGMSIGDACTKWGSLAAMSDAVKSLKLYAAMQAQVQLTEERRGRQVDRELVAGTVFPLVDHAFKRIVTEAPGAMATRIVALVLAGGRDDLAHAVEDLLRNELGSILTECRDAARQRVEAL